MNSIPVQTCKRCLYNTDHPLGLVLDSEGICSGCRVHEEKDTLDWDDRWQTLEKLVQPYRSRDSRNYDCIVPVTGGGDSFYTVYIVKECLGLKPLLVTYNRYYNTAIGIHNLSQLRRRFDCDILIQSVNPVSVKKIIRTTLRRFASFHWPALAGQSVFPVQTAVSHQIPLIIWGAHQGVEQVGMFSHLHDVQMSRRYRKDHDLMGYEADDLISPYDSLNEQDIWQYRYPDEQSIEQVGVRGIYLSNYIRWDSHKQNMLMANKCHYLSARLARTFDIYDHVDDYHYMGLHDIVKLRKCGYSRVTDHACREIRHGRLTRDNALSLVSFYQDNLPEQSIGNFCEWLNIDQASLEWILSQVIRGTNSTSPSQSKSNCFPIESISDSELSRDYLESNPYDSIYSLGSKPIVFGKGYDKDVCP